MIRKWQIKRRKRAMRVVIGADNEGMELKEWLKGKLLQKGFTVEDKSIQPSENFIASTLAITKDLKKHPESLGIAIDKYGAGSFIVATKVKGMIAATVSDERSAYMTREHNNSQMITLGSAIVGKELALNITIAFLGATYSGGRHQIRVDMLNKMG